jgi:hypothetical protein
LKCERVNVNTTDATTGATALLLVAQNLIRDTSRVSSLLTKLWRVDKMRESARSSLQQTPAHFQHPLDESAAAPSVGESAIRMRASLSPQSHRARVLSCGCHNALAIISAARTSAGRPAVIVVTTAPLRAASVFRRPSPPHSEHPHHHPSCDDGRLLRSRSFY